MTRPAAAAPSGAAMDRALPARPPWQQHRARWRWLALPAACAVAAALAIARQAQPQLQVVNVPQLAPVRAGSFRDELVLRARVEPLHSVQLDAGEAGLVEAVLAHDGDHVAAGAPLYQLRSPEQEQLLMQRSAEVAQQMANVSVQRSAQVQSLAQNRRELAQLEAAAQQTASAYERQAKLAVVGFASAAAVEEAGRQQQLAAQLLQQAQHDQRLDADIHAQSLAEMARAVQGLQRGLQLLERSRERLQQRAPMAGQLSGFGLQVGASVRPGDRLGRIDDPAGGVQLVADVDEYYLPRLQPGQTADSGGGGALTLAQTLPQVQAGKVKVLLHWAAGVAPDGLRPGQAVDVRLHLSEPGPALLLPDGPGVQSRLYVRRGHALERRSVQLGRRAAGQVEVLGGLAAGDEVLISQPPSEADRLALP